MHAGPGTGVDTHPSPLHPPTGPLLPPLPLARQTLHLAPTDFAEQVQVSRTRFGIRNWPLGLYPNFVYNDLSVVVGYNGMYLYIGLNTNLFYADWEAGIADPD